MKNNKKIAKYLSIFLSITILGGIILTPKTYGDENVPTVGEFYDLQLKLEDKESESNDINNNEDSSYDYSDTDDEFTDDYNYGDDDYYNNSDNDYYGDDNYYNDDSYYNEDNDDYSDYYDNNYDDNYDYYNDYDYNDDNYYDYSYDYYDFGGYTYDDYSYDSWDSFDYFDYDFDSYDFDYDFEDYEEEHVPGSKFLKTPTTLQYTFDLESAYPKYIDTGVRVSEEGTLDTNGLKEVFKQIAIRKNAKFVEDTNRVMALIDGKIIVAEGDVTKVETLEKIFEDTSLRIKAQSTRAGGKFNLADHLEDKGKIPIEINGERIELIVEPRIDNSRILFPIRSIGEAMGAEVDWNKEKAEATIRKDDVKIVLTGNSDIVKVNGKEYLLSSKTHLNNNEKRIRSLLNLIVKELGGTMEWNTTNSMLVITTPQEEVDLDEGL